MNRTAAEPQDFDELLQRLDQWADEGEKYQFAADAAKAIRELRTDAARMFVKQERAALSREPSVQTAKQRYDECMRDGEEPSAIERLRFFCSLAMNGQDWIDVEPFFDALNQPSGAQPVAWQHVYINNWNGTHRRIECSILPKPDEYDGWNWSESIPLYAAPAPSALPEMDKELEWILGRPNFACSGIFQTLRKGGHEIAKHAEEEQAASIYWMLGHYFKHGPDKWRDEAEKELKAIHQKSLAALPSRGGAGS